MDGFTAVLPTKFIIIIIINTYHSFARARERKRKLLPVVSLFLSFFSRLFMTQVRAPDRKKKHRARLYFVKAKEIRTRSLAILTHIEKLNVTSSAREHLERLLLREHRFSFCFFHPSEREKTFRVHI